MDFARLGAFSRYQRGIQLRIVVVSAKSFPLGSKDCRSLPPGKYSHDDMEGHPFRFSSTFLVAIKRFTPKRDAFSVRFQENYTQAQDHPVSNSAKNDSDTSILYIYIYYKHVFAWGMKAANRFKGRGR